jgi:hypothetical protein
MNRSAAIDWGVLVALVIAICFLCCHGIMVAAKTGRDCVILRGSNCGNATDDSQCSTGGTACVCCASSTAINAKICVDRECSNDCGMAKRPFLCGTDTRRGHCERVADLGFDCEPDGPPEQPNRCGSVTTCHRSLPPE